MGIHLNDIGTSFYGTVKNQDNIALDVSGAIDITFRFVKPSGELLDKEAIFVTDGTDGKVKYVSVAGDLDEIGWWSVQGIVELASSKWHSDICNFFVSRNL